MIKNKCCKLLCLLAAALLIICDVAGCKLSFEEDEVQSTVSEQEKTEKNKYARKARVAVIQYMNNPALNDCCEGVKKSLENTDFEFEVFVGSEESPEQDCEQTAQDMAELQTPGHCCTGKRNPKVKPAPFLRGLESPPVTRDQGNREKGPHEAAASSQW